MVKACGKPIPYSVIERYYTTIFHVAMLLHIAQEEEEEDCLLLTLQIYAMCLTNTFFFFLVEDVRVT